MSAIPQPNLPSAASAGAEVGSARNPFSTRTPEPEIAPEQPKRRRISDRGHRADSAKKPRRDRRPADTRDILLSLPIEMADRMESVLAYTLPHTGVKTQQAFIRRAILRACEDLEDEYNNGELWPAIPKPEAI